MVLDTKSPDLTPSMLKWDRRFLGLAKHVSTWSKDPKTKVGCIIVDPKNRIISQRFNGFPRGVDDSPEVYADRETKLMRVIHAEENALLFAARPVEGCTAYINYPPCSNCAAKLIQSGIARVVYLESDEAFSDRWQASLASAKAMFRQADVELSPLTPDRRNDQSQ